jgi:glycosyltransferase involved in cell wall biosynthesis
MRISIITACRNSVETVREAMQSVRRQSYADVEYLVLDGASIDGTQEAIRREARKFSRQVLWLSEPDHGLYDALNKGIRMATGEIIGLLHADDFYAGPEVLGNVAKRFEETGADAVYADVRFVHAEDLTRTVRYISGRRFRPWMMRYGFMPPHPAIFCRRALFGKLGCYRTDYPIAADHELMIRFLWKARIRTAYLPEPIITMRTGGMSTRSFGARWQGCRENVRACRENGIYANMPMQLLKYAVKVFEYI